MGESTVSAQIQESCNQKVYASLVIKLILEIINTKPLKYCQIAQSTKKNLRLSILIKV